MVQSSVGSPARRLISTGPSSIFIENWADGQVISTSPGMTFSALLAVRSGKISADNIANSLQPIRFSGPPQTIPRVSMSRLFSPGAENDPEIQKIKGKIVIIGAEYSAFQDIHLTPYAHSFPLCESRLMTGAEVHANIVQTLIDGNAPRRVHFVPRFVLLFVVISQITLLFFRLNQE